MSSETNKILTTDGIPLEVSLKKAERKNKIKAFLLVAPLLFFLIITYVFPIGDMLLRSVDDKMVTQMLPKTFKAMETWDGQELPDEEVFAAFHEDFIKLVDEKREGHQSEITFKFSLSGILSSKKLPTGLKQCIPVVIFKIFFPLLMQLHPRGIYPIRLASRDYRSFYLLFLFSRSNPP